MGSIIPGFEYDVFISYRHNDNRSGWVTQYAKALEEELAATIKEPVSVYFDENPHDGLLETHDVDDSLKEKLKCLIFIPVISQTYCDPKSFAWKNEFLVFLKMAAADAIGLKVKLPNGNTASRVLPIRIHELDAHDKKIIEAELGPLRAIDFTYHSAGVNRPLRPKDDETTKSISQNIYRDQINKTANAIKDIIMGLQGQGDRTFPQSAEAVDHSPITRQPYPKKQWKLIKPDVKTLWRLSVVMILLLSAALIYLSINKEPRSQDSGVAYKTSINLPDSIPLTFMADPLSLGRRGLDISPDGNDIVFVSMTPDGKSYLCLRSFGQYDIKRMPGTEGAYSPFFSPDSKWIAFFTEEKLMKISVDGSVIETLAQTATPAIDGIWGDGDRITWISNEGSVLSSVDSKGKNLKVSSPLTQLLSRPAALSSSEFITSTFSNELVLTSFNNSEQKLILNGAQNPVLFKDELFYVKGTDLLAIRFDRYKRATVGNPRLVEKNISVEAYGNAQFSISKNGVMVFANGTNSQMGNLSWRSVAGEIMPLPFPQELFRAFTISPDGRRLAATVTNEHGEIWIYDLDGSRNRIKLSNGTTPHWSTDGGSVFYENFENGKMRISRKEGDGRSEAQLILAYDSLFALWDMNEKEQMLYGISEKGKNFPVDLKFYSPHTPDTIQTFNSQKGDSEMLASFIQDDWIGYCSDETGRLEVYVADLRNPEVKIQVSFDGGEEPSFEPASSALYFRIGNKMMAVTLDFAANRKLKIGPAHLVFEDENWVSILGYSYDIAPDGKSFLIVRRSKAKSTNEIKVSQNFLKGFQSSDQ